MLRTITISSVSLVNTASLISVADVLPVAAGQEVEGLGGALGRLHQALALHVLAEQRDDVPEAVGHRVDGPLLVLLGHGKFDDGMVGTLRRLLWFPCPRHAIRSGSCCS